MMREGDVFNGPTGFVLPKNCPFLHDLDFYVEHMVQGGIVQKLLYKDVSARSITMHIIPSDSVVLDFPRILSYLPTYI